MDGNQDGHWLSATAQARGITSYQALAVHLSIEMGHAVGSTTAYRWWVGDRLVPRRYWPALSSILRIDLAEVALRASGFDPVKHEPEGEA